ncbi:MAG TPA: hypothetical protein PKV86_01150 [Syntrophobacteraceae bacterium]|jgi:hypothetical protein|nr:hypothetical protein [Syntrophobacteraceae bacterium]
MITIHGDIWKEFEERPESYLVIPTNVGWKADGKNVMGRGVAKQAAEKFPELPGIYGGWCQKYDGEVFVHVGRRVICAPTKPLNKDKPHMSWKSFSTFKDVRNSYRQIRDLANRGMEIVTPLLGAGNGGLKFTDAMKLAEEAKLPDNVILVLLKRKQDELPGEGEKDEKVNLDRILG